MSQPLLIKTGSTVAPLIPRRGDFEDWFAEGLGRSARELDIVRVHQGEALPPVSADAVVVVTGSPSMVTDEEPWSVATQAWLGEAARAGAAILGICYGHQLLARALGGRAGWNPRGREIGSVRVALTEEGRRDLLLSGLGDELVVQTSHSQSVLALPPDAVLLAGNGHDALQGFRWGERVWSFQFHPEFDADILRGYLEDREEAVASEGIDVAEKLGELQDSTAGSAILARFAKFAGARPASRLPE